MRSPKKKKVELVIVENNINYLMRRYKVSRETIHDWRQFLGLSTARNKHYFDPEEVLELDYFFAAAHIPQKDRSKFWGLMMGKEMYAKYILDAEITFDKYLSQKFGVSYEEFLYQASVRFGFELFGS